MATTESKNFRRDRRAVYGYVLAALFFGIVGLWTLSDGSSITGFLFLVASLAGLIDCLLIMRLPFISITNTEIVLFRDIDSFRRTKHLKPGTIKEINRVEENKIVIVLANRKTIKINLTRIYKRDRENLIVALETVVASGIQ